MEEKVLLDATVVFPFKENRAGFGLKLAKIGEGCLNGWGGGVEPGETPKASGIREIKEETGGKDNPSFGINAREEDLEKVAIINFHNIKDDGKLFVCKVHFYFLRKWDGQIKDTDEMKFDNWYDLNNLPIERMMPGDKDFMPQIFSGKKVIGSVYYKNRQKELYQPSEITEVDELPEN